MKANYKDGEAHCEATDQTLTLRCDMHGVITCRGPENIRKYQRKCKSNTDPLCAVAIMAADLRKVKAADFKAKKKAWQKVLTPRPAGHLWEMKAVCKGTNKPVVISVYGTGAVICSIKGCELHNHKNCPTMRLYEAVKQIIAIKRMTGRKKLTPEEFKEGMAKAKAKIDGMVETPNP